jgi:hypothetical protein
MSAFRFVVFGEVATSYRGVRNGSDARSRKKSLTPVAYLDALPRSEGDPPSRLSRFSEGKKCISQ